MSPVRLLVLSKHPPAHVCGCGRVRGGLGSSVDGDGWMGVPRGWVWVRAMVEWRINPGYVFSQWYMWVDKCFTVVPIHAVTAHVHSGSRERYFRCNIWEYSVPGFINKLTLLHSVLSLSTRQSLLIMHFCSQVRIIWVLITDGRLLSPQSIVSKYASQFRGNSQHDALEFLLWLLDRVHEDASAKTNGSSKVRP